MNPLYFFRNIWFRRGTKYIICGGLMYFGSNQALLFVNILNNYYQESKIIRTLDIGVEIKLISRDNVF